MSGKNPMDFCCKERVGAKASFLELFLKIGLKTFDSKFCYGFLSQAFGSKEHARRDALDRPGGCEGDEAGRFCEAGESGAARFVRREGLALKGGFDGGCFFLSFFLCLVNGDSSCFELVVFRLGGF